VWRRHGIDRTGAGYGRLLNIQQPQRLAARPFRCQAREIIEGVSVYDF
jgi:hypothetical protein